MGGLQKLIDRKLACIIFLVTTIVSLVLAAFFYTRGKLKESRLSALLIKQMECTHQAERRSLNKTTAFASATHDIRGALACLTTLVELCYDLVPNGSQVEDKLRQMQCCTQDLIELLNSVLDTSKVEAGKIELEDEEFNLAHLLEEVADFYHPTSMKKGAELVLDPCDDSISKFANVRGDRIRLKQILCNLVSNAIKFTPKGGSVSIRAWAKSTQSLKSSILASHRSCLLSWFSQLFLNDEDCKDLEAIKSISSSNCMEFVFEVDDTGKGIAKDKQKSVFENYVQVKDSLLGREGTGLGLGIVQSLVRLMGGDISILDKESGKKGTCFRFNIFLTVCNDQQEADKDNAEADIEAPAEITLEKMSNIPYHHEIDGSSMVVLLIHNPERRRVIKKYLERLGIKVLIVKHWEYFQGHLRRMKTKMCQSQNKMSSMSDWTSSQSDCISAKSASRKFGKEVPMSSLDGIDQSLARPGARARVNRGEPNFILFLIDVSAGLIKELVAAMDEFRRDLDTSVKFKVVWLEKEAEGCSYSLIQNVRPEDVILLKTLHGSTLHRVVKILPEFGGYVVDNGKVEAKLESLEMPRELSSRKARVKGDDIRPLSGLKILVAEDIPCLAALARAHVKKLGADVHLCKNGTQALEMVVQGLRKHLHLHESSSQRLPFDVILMDCEMPEMNGFEATREIRKVEKRFNVHIPIIALTAHISEDQIQETRLAGMDEYLAKPIKIKELVETITRVCST